MTRRLWAVFLAALVVVAGGGLFALSAAGVFSRTQPTADPPPTPTPTPQPSKPVQPSSPALPHSPTPTTRPSNPARSHPTPRYVFPVGGCRADASQSHHDYPASDIFAKVGCLFVAPVNGRVDEVTRVDTWDPKTNRGPDRGGLSVSIVGVDGVRYYGSHLSAIAPGIRPGVIVRAGQTLAHTGKTGSARVTPPHLHFGISWPTKPNMWWIRRGAVAPQQFLNSWHHGGQLSPVSTVAKTHRTYGADNGCRSYC
ncbi:M23 family metallopeptidase [Kribbella jiaozuonensis]|uniref:M23 family metallopeptidase n=1 Tax=Kribbella jiaozuonensis TaxID=2575441 RepID=UPI002D76FF80|nr:M23 family metallopeptidase [Kribbella jiaozuonensis]